MKKISPAERVSRIEEYYFSKKLAEVARLNAEGKDIISLGIGGPDLPPSREVRETLCREAMADNTHGYQLTKGTPGLRRAYSGWLQHSFGVDFNPDTEILPLIGSKEAVMQISLAFLNPGDGVLIPDPGYPTYTSASKLVGAEIFNYDLKEENGWMPDFEELEKLPLDKIKVMWANYPHMPTGTPATPEVHRKLVDFCRRHGILLVHDNPYCFILNPEPRSIMQVEGAREVAIELNSLSKSHNMAGWRMAVMASNPTFIQWVLKVKSNMDSGQFLPMMKATEKALSLPKEWNESLNREYALRRTLAEEIMTALGCSFDQKQTGLFLWGRIPENIEDVETFTDKILYDARVFVTPGFIFGRNGKRYIRISLCATPENMRRALERIKSNL